VFQSPEWLLSWWPVFGSGELFTVCVREEGGRLVGLAPMFILPWNGRRQVTFIGNGVSDELGFIVDRACAVEAAAAILDGISAAREHWDLCDLQDLPPTSVLHRAAIPDGVCHGMRPQYVCSSIPLPRHWEQFAAGLPHGLRRNLRRYREKLERLGPIAFETADESTLPEHIDALVNLHRVRWLARHDDEGMIAGRQMETFHRAAALALYYRGIARFHALRLDGRIVASVYALVENGRACGYLTGFDPALEAFSLGSLMLGYTIRRSIEEGVMEFDFLRGEEPYKTTWGARQRQSSRLLLWHTEKHRPA